MESFCCTTCRRTCRCLNGLVERDRVDLRMFARKGDKDVHGIPLYQLLEHCARQSSSLFFDM